MSGRGRGMRRAGGRPNRGGGRHNRPRGRGRSKPSIGCEGRKAGASAVAQGYADYVELHEKEPKQEYHPRPFRGRRALSKVTMQKLHMTMENQEMVKDMLKVLHGGEDLEPYCEDDYDELDYYEDVDKRYWTNDSKLMVEDSMSHVTSYENFDEDTSQPVVISRIAINKLQRYGFNRARCQAALEQHDGDIGQSLEYLLSECFHTEMKIPSVDSTQVSGSDSDDPDFMAELLEQRDEEKLALEAIFADAFQERIANHIWFISLELSSLTELFQTERTSKNTQSSDIVKHNVDKKQLCQFFLKGSCRYGSRCRYIHGGITTVTSNTSDQPWKEDTTPIYELEVRFPAGHKYPFQVPYIAFSSISDKVPGQKCLLITKRLMQEAVEHAEAGLPVVYSLVSILQNKDELEEILGQGALSSSFPAPVISKRQMSEAAATAAQLERADMFLDPKTNKPSNKASEEVVDDNGDDEDLDDGATKREDLRNRYGRKDIIPMSAPSRIIERNNRKLKAMFDRKQDSQAYQKMQGQRKKLPAWEYQDQILSALSKSQVLVVSGMTGCGKTTQVPQFIVDSFLKRKGTAMCNIVCTQPRRISAMAVAERVAEERADRLGALVGYQIRMESCMSQSTRLLFCTTGILLRRLEGDIMVKDITHIIVDEVHERSEESDFLLMVLRDLLLRRQDLKLVLMSATLNAALFSQYFGGCPDIEIPGKTFPVEQLFLEDAIEFSRFIMDDLSPYARPLMKANAKRSDKGSYRPSTEEIDEDLYSVNVHMDAPARDNIQDQNLSVKQLFLRFYDYKKSTIKALSMMDHEKINFDLIEELVEAILAGNHEYPDGAILIFLPGMAEITTLYERLKGGPSLRRRDNRRLKIIPLHSTLSSEDQHAVFNKPPKGVTKIVIATNIAETSITIDDVVYVIDAGRMKEKRFDPTKGMESLDIEWVSRANAKQRMGRAGRVASGVCFHLFTSHRYEFHLREQPVPEIQRAPLEQIVLRVKTLELFRDKKVAEVLSYIIEAPSPYSITSAIKRLEDLGALDLNEDLTPLGYHLSSLPVDVRIGKLMLFGAIFRCLEPALTIAASLSYRSPFVSPFGKKEEATQKKCEFAVGNSDHLTTLKAYKAWLAAEKHSSNAGYRFCQDNYLSIKSLQMLASMKRQFTELLSDIGFVREGLISRDIERAKRPGSDGVLEVTGREANSNSENMKLLAAILVAALYPNIVQVLTPEAKYVQSTGGAVPMPPKAEELKFKTKEEGYVFIHPSSVNFQVRYYESPYLVYHEKIKTSKVYIRDSTMVSVYPLMLFGGGSVSIDLDRGNFVLSVDDGWIRFMAASHQVAELVRELRLELDQLLQDKIQNPNMDLCTCPRGNSIIQTIVTLISTQ